MKIYIEPCDGWIGFYWDKKKRVLYICPLPFVVIKIKKRDRIMTETFRIITVCGSMRFWEEMLEVAQDYTAAGFIVLMPFIADYVNGQTADDRKLMLDRMHLAKIDMSEAIAVVTAGSGYIGESTRNEIEYAKATGKAVIYS